MRFIFAAICSLCFLCSCAHRPRQSVASGIPLCAQQSKKKPAICEPVGKETKVAELVPHFVNTSTEKLGYQNSLPSEVNEEETGSSLALSDWLRWRTQTTGPEGGPEDVENLQGNAQQQAVQPVPPDANIPATFSLQVAYPDCSNITMILIQGHCGACWANATAASLAGNICVQYARQYASKVTAEVANLKLSPQYLIDCSIGYHVNKRGQSPNFGCGGGHIGPTYAFAEGGIPSYACKPSLFNSTARGSLSCAGSCC